MADTPHYPMKTTIAKIIKTYPFAVLGLGFLLFSAGAVMVGPILYAVPYDRIDFAQSSLPPSFEHPFGTNDLGQDQLARILIGGRITLTVGVTAMIVSLSLGTLIGAIAGFYGGWFDSILMGFTDLCLSLPQLPLLLLVIYLFRDAIKAIAGPELGIFMLIVAVIGGLNWMGVARLVRSSFLKIKGMEFVTAAVTMGASSLRIMGYHIFPNLLPMIIVAATLGVGNAILLESSLSFLGLGFPPDVPTWGRLLYEAQNYLTTAPYLALFPGMIIFLTVLSINYLGEGLRDWLDPKS
jgi:peptide/nickel transport system permease protein